MQLQTSSSLLSNASTVRCKDIIHKIKFNKIRLLFKRNFIFFIFCSSNYFSFNFLAFFIREKISVFYLSLSKYLHYNTISFSTSNFHHSLNIQTLACDLPSNFSVTYRYNFMYLHLSKCYNFCFRPLLTVNKKRD